MANALKDIEAGADKKLASNGVSHSASFNALGSMSGGGGGMKKSLSKAFLSTGMAVTFKVSFSEADDIAHCLYQATLLFCFFGCVVIDASPPPPSNSSLTGCHLQGAKQHEQKGNPYHPQQR
jgi:hypothetical protein